MAGAERKARHTSSHSPLRLVAFDRHRDAAAIMIVDIGRCLHGILRRRIKSAPAAPAGHEGIEMDRMRDVVAGTSARQPFPETYAIVS